MRGKWVSFDKHTINHLCGLGKVSDGAKFKRLKKNPDYQKILKVLTDGKREWIGSKKSLNASIAGGQLTKEAKVWFYFLSSMLMHSKHVCTMRKEEEILLYAVLKGYKISFGKIIEKSILGYQSSKFWGHIPHLSIITHLCLKGGVTFDKDEEEKCPAISPLTLTTIIKNAASKCKKKLNEAEEERGDRGVEVNISEPNNQALAVSIVKTRNERERSASPDWVIYLEAATHKKDQAESSSQQGNN